MAILTGSRRHVLMPACHDQRRRSCCIVPSMRPDPISSSTREGFPPSLFAIMSTAHRSSGLASVSPSTSSASSWKRLSDASPSAPTPKMGALPLRGAPRPAAPTPLATSELNHWSPPLFSQGCQEIPSFHRGPPARVAGLAKCGPIGTMSFLFCPSIYLNPIQVLNFKNSYEIHLN
jgi:hypothetical protein